ncbi:DUF2254 domain-containing protein [Bacillus luteolus]|uniref:DUF2254 domain-containing protein n=1 Tax=Litchfieldia luteola TaxID=682179 RepID=A0ABR9QH70_9BACI|nr:DUF2254 domain-containing protein [Cytobacillus luteolus]MBE4907835.1 DUF2254 domain-containing protein [Cytobacillus luteolus]
MGFSNLFIRIRQRFWYLPSLYGLIAAFLAVFSMEINTYIVNTEVLVTFLPAFLLTDINLAQTILSSISASLLTMTTITFSTILVVLTTYLSQFSPRTLQNFITDHSTQRVLGIFVGGFIYSILLLLLLRETDTTTTFIVPAIAIFISIVCLLVFVFFIHHVTGWIQVSNLIHTITLETIDKINKDLKDVKDVQEDPPWEDWESEEIKHIPPKHFSLNGSGYIQYIDIEGLVKQATKEDCIIRIEKEVNDYVDEDTPLLSLWFLSTHQVRGNYDKYFIIGSEQAAVNDIEFGLTKIVEIGLRALSPGINDPNTAINCIDNLGKILTKLGSKHLPKSYHNDDNRNLRVIYKKPDFSDYLYKCFFQIRQYGFSDISVLTAGIKALTLIAESNSKPIKELVWEFSEYIIEGIDKNILLSLDRRYINEQLEALAKATGHKSDYKAI